MAKINGNNLWFKVIGIIIVLLSVAVTYGLLAANVQDNTDDIKILAPKVDMNTEGRKEVQTDIKWIRSTLERIEKNQ